jgi:hypothetical protein
VDINQHGVLLVVISQQTEQPARRAFGSILGGNCTFIDINTFLICVHLNISRMATFL